jgi:Zn finger protein HypA/HybF involved in hydrogenase expression
MGKEKIMVQCQKCGRTGELKKFGIFCPHCNGNYCKEIKPEKEGKGN